MPRLTKLFRPIAIAALLIASMLSGASAQKVHVRGYTKKDGTVVRPHDRAAPGTAGGVSGSSSSGSVRGSAPRLPYSARTERAPRKLELRPIPGPRIPASSAPRRNAVVRVPTSSAVGAHRDARGRIQRSSEQKHLFEWQTGHPHGWPGHVVDHIVPLACGGADAPNNMQWQTTAEAKAKDRVERVGCSSGRRP
jgi:hypothetical protein